MSENIDKVGMRPSHPGAFIFDEILEPLDLSVSSAAQALGVDASTLSALVNGMAPLSPEMALRIEKAFDVSMDSLLRMQAWFDACAMRERAGEINVSRFQRPVPAGD